MRELLFRGKTLDVSEWVYGYYVQQYGTDAIYFKESDENGFERLPIYSETVGQYTGLNDKNGVKIFEGDIVKYAGEIHQVVFEKRNGNAYFGIAISKTETWQFCCEVPADEMEVIGNIYDDPELLKVR